ncbi:MAG: hypothetical protein WBX02_16400 [Terriglobales bacterium]
MRLLLCVCLGVATSIVCANEICAAQDLRAPSSVTAGEASAISTTGSGKATFYFVGPGVANKSEISLGNEIPLRAQDLRDAGEYLAILCSDSCRSASFYVTPAKPASLAFLVHPSRVPVAESDAVSGVALAFDQFGNLVVDAGTINFQLTAGKTSLLSRGVAAHDGIAWFRTTSSKSAGPLQVVASIGELSARRNVQEVASEPCNLRITGQRTKDGLVVETEPVRDCAGNPVPDGTIVSFTATDASGKSTVDAPIKRGIARAEITASGPVVVSVASGVAMGNELRIGGGQ